MPFRTPSAYAASCLIALVIAPLVASAQTMNAPEHSKDADVGGATVPVGTLPDSHREHVASEGESPTPATAEPMVTAAPLSTAVIVPAPTTTVRAEPKSAERLPAEQSREFRLTGTVTPTPKNSEPTPPLESNVVSLAGREGFRWRTQRGDFEFNPYTLVQTYVQGNYVSTRWLALTDQDDAKALGFGIGNAILGIAGRGFERVTFNLALNAACTGGCLLNQAWMDLAASEALRLRIGKFKTPAHWAVQIRLGQSLFPRMPTSLSARVNLPFGLNSVNPAMALGFDTGIMLHGILARRVEYQVGVFNGEGIAVNAPTSTLRDDRGVPGFLYAARVAYYPLGIMKPEESAALESTSTQMLVALSSSYNVEANSESSDDWRAGAEAAFRTRGLYLSAEAYLLRMAFVERQRGEAARTFWGGYGQIGIDVGRGLEPIARFEAFDRNSLSEGGVLLLPAVGLNWYLSGQNLKLSSAYQTLVRSRYRSELQAHQDDNAIYDHTGLVQLQFSL